MKLATILQTMLTTDLDTKRLPIKCPVCMYTTRPAFEATPFGITSGKRVITIDSP